ncbi:FKBP-type peptidyl-prolyl cis-trans isomerase [Flavobacterium sp. N3904]|uniref:FKBP-type peptidyl-prolyl cis-trans isomerase n=1 Tax=Flavobacterium sp. N3904 TaxID=2986835 RepID=UPI002225198D|nr:FKBP-type peptidyl-prolyl cis-trans isomerase [Flavobacterium sp. N3904]
MSKIKFYFILLIATIAVISCNKDDNSVTPTPVKPYAEQYPIDSLAINTYLKTNYFTVLNHPGFPDDQDVTITKITPTGNQPSIWSYLNSPTLPKLLSREVYHNKITYKIYYLVIKEGVKDANGIGGESPCNVDAVFTGYKGTLLDGSVFDSSNNGQLQFNLDGSNSNGGVGVFVKGWSEIFPQFKTGTYTSKNDGTVVYNDFGVGVMFLPSGLGYYNASQTGIPAYSPLVFSIKLYALKRIDHEFKYVGTIAVAEPDGIPSYLEDINRDGYVRTTSQLPPGDLNPDDSDKDGTPDFLDFDDDGDNYATRGEIKDTNGNYYPYDLIPDCSGNIPTDIKKKRHLDASCHFMNQ